MSGLSKRGLLLGAGAGLLLPLQAWAGRSLYARPSRPSSKINFGHPLARNVRLATLAENRGGNSAPAGRQEFQNMVTGEWGADPGGSNGWTYFGSQPYLGLGIGMGSLADRCVFTKGFVSEVVTERTYLLVARCDQPNPFGDVTVPLADTTGSNGTLLQVGAAGQLIFTIRTVVDAPSGITIPTGKPCAIGMSWSQKTGNVNFVLRRLDTGQISKFINAANTTSPPATTGGYSLMGLASVPDGGTFIGPIAAAAITSSFASMSELWAWANDPWAFWYPPGPSEALAQFAAGAAGGSSGMLMRGMP